MEHDAVQLSWSSLPIGTTIEIAGRSFEVGDDPPAWYRRRLGRRPGAGRSGPGALSVGALDVATTYDVTVSGAGTPRRLVTRARTLGPPPGAVLARFATISDCHFGERTFGPTRRLHDPVPRPEGMAPYTVRCAGAAIDEAERWGAQTLVAKGDLTQDGEASEISTAVDVLRRAGVPVAVALGNHDVRGPVDTGAALSKAGFHAGEDASHVDLPGGRVVLGHSPIPHRHSGRIPAAHTAQLAALAGSAPGPAVVVLHHPLRRWPVETHYPPSTSWRDSRRLSAALLSANPAVLVLSGHTHRNRLYRAAGLLVAEVGSTKDYPGQWAGYTLYEGGIRQVVRRVAAPEAIAWNEMTSLALGGLWGMWSPGRLGDRCWTVHWPGRVERAMPAGRRDG